MSIANVTLNDTFAEWIDKTNQIKVQGQNNYTLSVSTFLAANNVFLTANLAFSKANTANTTADLAFAKANTANITADLAFAKANTANITADLAFEKGNIAYTQANAAYTQANIAFTTANSGWDQGNTAYTQANIAFTTANSGWDQANTARDQGNTAYTQANIAFTTANSGWAQANTARDRANLSLANGMSNTFIALTIGTLSLTGNLAASGNIADSKGDVRIIPPTQVAAAYTLAKTDVGKFVTISSSSNVFVPNTIFTAGDAVTIYNNSSASMNIVSNTAVTLRLAGTATTGSRSLSQRGIATVLCVFANNFVISGIGVS